MQQEKIEIVDRDLNEKTTYTLHKHTTLDGENLDEELDEPDLIKFIRFIIKTCKLSLYICINLIQCILNLMKVVFNMTDDYKPFKPITDIYTNHMINRTKDYMNEHIKAHAVRTHKYEFIRSRSYARNYMMIDKLLTNIYKNNAELDEILYKDIMLRIDTLICESEKQAFAESYKYAKESHYRFESTDAFNRYIKDRVMKGEDHKDANKQLLEELKEQYNK